MATKASPIVKFLRDDLLIMPKMLYFGLNLVVYAVHTYSAKFFSTEWNLRIYQFGYVAAFSGASFFGAMFWSAIADKINRPKLLINLCTVLYCVFTCLMLVPLFDKKEQPWLSGAYLASCFGLGQFALSGCFPLLDAVVMAMLAKDPRNGKEIFGRQRLWGSIAHSVATGLSDLSIKIAGFLAAGRFLEHAEEKSGIFAAAAQRGPFGMLGICTVLFMLAVTAGVPNNLEVDLKKRGHGHHAPPPTGSQGQQGQSSGTATGAAVEESHEDQAASQQSPLIRLIMMPSFVFFLLFAVVAGYVRSIMTYFQPYFITEVLGQKNTVMTIAGIFRAITEVAVFFMGKQFMAWMGPHWMLIASQIAGIVRIIGYYFLPIPAPKDPKAPTRDINTGKKLFVEKQPMPTWSMAALFALELLKGVNTGFVVSAAIQLAFSIAPPGCGNTAQGLFSGVYTGLASVVGGAFGGLLIYLSKPENDPEGDFGLAKMFMVSAVITTITTGLFVLKYGFVDKKLWGRSPVAAAH